MASLPDGWCTFSLMPAGICPHCATQPHAATVPPPQAEPQWVPQPGPWVNAVARQVCQQGCVINPGEAYRADGLGGFLCAGCGAD